MDDSWHFRPIPDYQLCPVCSTHHYPFCAHSSHFAGDNLSFFPSDLRPSHFHRPFYNLSHPPPFPAPQPTGSVPFWPPFHRSPFVHEEARERESFRKRMRMEDQAIGVFPPFEPFERTLSVENERRPFERTLSVENERRPFERTLSVENERRLNLVRSHGMEGAAQVQDGYHLNNNSDYRMDRHTYDYDVEQKHFSNRGIDHSIPESDFHHRNGYSHAHAYEDYRNQQISSLNREDRFMPQERRDFERLEFESDRRGTLDSQIGDCYPYGQSAQFDKTSLVPRFHRSDEALGGSEDFQSSALQRSFQKDSFRSASYSTNVDNPVRVGNFLDQQPSHSMLGTSHLLPIANFSPEPCHQDATQNQMVKKSEFYIQQEEVRRASFHHWPPISVEIHKPLDAHAYPVVDQLGLNTSKQAGYGPVAAEINHVMPTSMQEHAHTSQTYPPTPSQSLFAEVNHARDTSIPDHGHSSQAYPSVPPQPLFPIQTEPSLSSLQVASSATASISAASPAGAISSAKRQFPSNGSQSLPQGEFCNEPSLQASNGFAIEGSPFTHQSSLKMDERGPSFPVKQSWKEKPAYVDASHLFKQPHRASRPDHIAIILRGFPGSGKSYLAKALRDIEVENGGSAPRIHAMDDYFMMEVEKKVEDNDGCKSSGSVRSKKQTTKKVIEYCYEPEMEEAYRSSMLKAFKKTLDDGIFTLVIVDDRNLRVADFAQFWAIAKRSGYEVYLLEATYKDPVGCAARNIHGFRLDDIQKMVKQWEEAPPLYLHLDIQSLFSGDDLIDQSIQEVDMDADDTVGDEEPHHLEETDDWNSTELKSLDQESDHGSTTLGKRWNTEEVEVIPEKNDLQKSKWSKDPSANLYDSNSSIGNTNALSGLIQAYGKDSKVVHWGDKDETSGFSIGVNKKQIVSSLIIGPGAGYNLKLNPLPEENLVEEAPRKISNDTKRRFSEQLRAESETFRAVFDRRRHRVGGLWDADDE